MPDERHVNAGGIVARGSVAGRGVHASVVALAGRGLLLVGPSRSGKSRLAIALIAASRPRRPIVLVGDDRIQLAPRPAGIVARPHPRIAGFIERRGLGIVALPYRAEAPLAAVVAIGDMGACDMGACDMGACDMNSADTLGSADMVGLAGLPRLALAAIDDAAEASTMVLRWWDALPVRDVARAGAKCATAPGVRA